MALDSVKRARLAKFAPLEDLAEVVHHQHGCLQAVWDFSVQGGAVGDIDLLDVFGKKALLPSGALIRDIAVHVETLVTSGGAATLALKSEGAADLLGATAVASFAANANLDGVPVGTAATVVRLTAERTLKLTVAVTALTAGKVHAFVDYVVRS
jgi:hypothetical protein